MTMDADVLLDTNILLTATDPFRTRHAAARRVLGEWPRLYVCGQILREYLVVATRPRPDNGLGLPLNQALDNVTMFSLDLLYLTEDEQVLDSFYGLLEEVPCHGRQIHDAHLASVAMRYGIGSILTENRKHFRRFSNFLTLPELPDPS